MANDFLSQLDEPSEDASYAIEGLFDYDDEDYSPAFEALEDDLNNLGKVDGSAEAENDEEPAEAPTEDEGGEAPAEDGADGETPDLAAATDAQLEADNQDNDDTTLDGGEDTGEATDEPAPTDTADTTPAGDDPLKSLETKAAYKDKLYKLYAVVTDSIETMDTYTPEYTINVSTMYYKLRERLLELKQIIFDVSTKKISSLPVDEVLRKYQEANITYDAIMADLEKFTKEYERERKKADATENRAKINMPAKAVNDGLKKMSAARRSKQQSK